MIVIGVTGGIGSGKSTVCSMFEKKSVPIFYADESARTISDTSGFQSIVEEFGNDILAAPKMLDRKKLAEIVFNNPERLDQLNSIIHPLVFESFQQWKAGLPSTTKFALVEAALMFESGMFEMMDYVLAVITDEERRIERSVVRDGSNEAAVKARMKNQISAEELLELSDFQIYNNGSIDDLSAKVNFFSLLFSTLTVPPDSV
jgi:dephospho-CoA kinase